MRGAHGSRRYAIPFKIKPARGQLSSHGSHSSMKEVCHVLHDDVAGSNHANGAHHLPEESRTGSGKAGALAEGADVLAREAAANDISLSLLKLGLLNIAVDLSGWEMTAQHVGAVGIDLHRADRLEPARALEPQVKATDTCEEAKDAIRHRPTSSIVQPPPAFFGLGIAVLNTNG